MELYFLRHAIAVERGTPKYTDDTKRPLTTQGTTKMFNCARGMKALGLSFDAILCSPYIRAKQTALIVTQVFQLKSTAIHFTQNLTGETTFEALLQELRTQFPKSKSVLLVGHQPHLTQCIAYLLNNESLLPIDLKKGGLCCLSWKGRRNKGDSALQWVLTPAQLRLLGSLKTT